MNPNINDTNNKFNNIINCNNIINDININSTNNNTDIRSNNNISKNNSNNNIGNINAPHKSKNKYGKCSHCNKKLKMINFTCKCGLKFCISHHNPHQHNCKYDSVKEKKQFIIDNNPKLGSKINKI